MGEPDRGRERVRVKDGCVGAGIRLNCAKNTNAG